MRALTTLFAGAVVFLVAMAGVQARQAGPAPACRVSGRVSGAGTPLPGVAITLRRGTTVQGATSSGVDGSYRINAPAGEFDLAFELTGFSPVQRHVAIDPATCPQSLDVALSLAPRAPRQAAAPSRGQAGAQRFQTLALQPGAAAAEAATEDGDAAPPLLLPPGFAAEAAADAIAVNGADARVDRGQLTDRQAAIGRGEFVPGAEVGGPGAPGPEGGPPQGRNGAGGPGGRFGGRGGRGFVLGGRGGAQNRVTATADYGFGGSALDSAPYQLRADVPATERPYTQQRFGTTIGGPIRIPHLYDGTGRTTFTLSYNGSRGASLFDQYATVPTEAMRTGDLSSIPVPLVDPATGAPFPGNQIPSSAISPPSQALLRLIPLPNLTGATRNYHYSTTTSSTSDAVNLRVAHNFTPNAGPAGRFGRGGGAGFGGGGARGGGRGRNGPAQRGTSMSLTGQFQYRRNGGDQANIFSTLGGHNTSSSLTAPLSLNVVAGRMLHNVNVQVSRTASSTLNRFSGIENIAADAGISGVSQDPFAWGVPSLSFSSITGVRDVSPSSRSDRRISAGYTWTHPGTRHVLRAGGDVRWDRSTSHVEPNAAGTFLFSGLYSTGGAGGVRGADFADFLLGMPQQASVQYGPGDVTLTGRSTSLFAQDNWRMRPSLTLNLGVRYELLWPYVEANNRLANLDVANGFTAAAPVLAGATGPFTGGFPSALLRNDTNNVAPRVGAAWRMRQGFVVRGGYGVSYNSGSYAGIARQLATQPPFAVANTRIGTINSVLLLDSALSGGSADETTNTYGVDKNYALGRVQSWNVDVTRTFARTWIAGAGYTYTRGASLDILRAPNRGPAGLRIADVQPFLWQSSEGSSRLHSATFRLQRRQVRGLGWRVVYTLAKSRDNAPSIGGGGGAAVVAQNDQNLNAEWGLSNFDRRHRVTADVQYELPFGANRRWLVNGGPWAALLENWRLSATFEADAGTPLTPRLQSSARDAAQGINGALRADYNGAPVAVDAPTLDRFFNTAAFGVPAAGLFGTAPRNIIIGPGSRQLNAQISRDVPLTGTRALTIQFGITNLLNNVNYLAIDTYVNSPTFGEVLSVRPMRSAQLNLRFRF